MKEKHRNLQDLAPNPGNPRTCSDAKLTMLAASLQRFGDLGGIVFNRRSQQLVGGHQRVKALKTADEEIVITKRHETPTHTGTIAEGHVYVDGERYSYREVEWDEAAEKGANLAANKGAGDFDLGLVAGWMADLEIAEFDMDLTMFDIDERNMLAYELKAEPSEATSDGPAHAEPSEMGKAQGQDKDAEIDVESFDDMSAQCPRCGFHFDAKEK